MLIFYDFLEETVTKVLQNVLPIYKEPNSLKYSLHEINHSIRHGLHLQYIK